VATVFSQDGKKRDRAKLHKILVSACSGYCSGLGWLTNNRNLSLTVPESGKSKIKVAADPVSGEAGFLVHRGCLFPVSSHGRKNE
jgi:hypothetical protein